MLSPKLWLDSWTSQFFSLNLSLFYALLICPPLSLYTTCVYVCMFIYWHLYIHIYVCGWRGVRCVGVCFCIFKHISLPFLYDISVENFTCCRCDPKLFWWLSKEYIVSVLCLSLIILQAWGYLIFSPLV